MTGGSSIDTGRERTSVGRSRLVAGLLALAFVVALLAGAASLAIADGAATPSAVAPSASPPTATNATLSVTTVSTQTTQTDAVVQGVSVSGEAVAVREDGTVYLWQSRPYSLTVTVGQVTTAGEYRVCALTEAAELDCTKTSLGPATDGKVELGSVKSTPLGAQNVTVTLARVGANETVVASQFLRIHVLSPTGDFDADGLRNRAEQNAGTDPTRTDTDHDLLGDSTEASLGTDPTSPRTAVGVVAGVLVALGVVVALASRYAEGAVGALGGVRVSDRPRSGVRSDSGARRESKPAESELAKSARGDSAPPESTASESGARPRGDGRGSTSADSERDGDAEIRDDPTPPLSDRERVIQLLEDNDGKLPQSEIVSETPWSKSKVSRLLARMDAQGQIVKISAGRQNIIVLPGEEPVELQSLRDGDGE